MALIDNNPLTPNEDYFRHIDAILAKAESNAQYIGILPTWGDKVSQRWGVGPVIFTPHTARLYGEWLGQRYRDRPNIIWVLGGDRNPIDPQDVDTAPVWRAMAAGLRQGTGGETLMTYHPQGGSGSSMWFHHDDWLDFHLWQSGHMQPDTPIWDWIAQDWNRIPPKPTMDGEPNYEDHPINPFSRMWKPAYGRFNDYDVRKQAYRSVFSGACGHIYGHHSVWQFYAPPREPINFPDPSWQDALDRPGAAQMQYLRHLIEAYPMLLRCPDPSLLASNPDEAARQLCATRESRGVYAMIYIPVSGYGFEVDMRRLKGEHVRALWFDPRTGTTTPIDDCSTEGVARFVTPSQGPDWVLILESL